MLFRSQQAPTPSASTTPVPGVIGLAEADARSKLLAAGFTVIAPDRFSAPIPLVCAVGDVCSVSPDQGTSADTSKPVTLTVAQKSGSSSGPKPAAPAAPADGPDTGTSTPGIQNATLLRQLLSPGSPSSA